jgi:hypothetical protein
MNGIRISCLWPGLAGAWHRGLTGSLAAAVVWAWAISVLLLATWFWTDWFPGWLVRSAWVVGALSWIVSSVVSHFRFASLFQITTPEQSRALERAQQEYLQGNWFEAEAILLEVVHRQPRDAECLLLLAGVLRQTRRWQPALRRLKQLEMLDTAAKWSFEVQQEKKMIEREISEDAATEAHGLTDISKVTPRETGSTDEIAQAGAGLSGS